MNASPFAPPFYLRNAMLQTFLGSKRPGVFRPQSMVDAAEPMILTTPGGVRLGGAFSAATAGSTRGLIILLHGWEGSIDSAYIKATGQFFFRQRFDIFRLNLRDHGDTHYLNEGLFYATLLEEIYAAVLQASLLARNVPVYLCGFSLGGNFALRIAARLSQSAQNEAPISGIVAISPVLDPSKATDTIDKNPPVLRYFLKKWRRSLKIKQQLFPQLYDFSEVLELSNLRRMTEKLIDRYAPHASADEYFSNYAFCSRDLETIQIPTTIITAEDDPVIPISDFYQLPTSRHVLLVIHPHGGHNGFIQNVLGQSWYEDYLLKMFLASQATEGVQN